MLYREILTKAQTRQAQQARRAASARQVFETPELLEIILLLACEIDMRTVFFSQKVNRTFNATIDGSIQLQRALFFRREGTEPTPAYSVAESANMLINPLFDVPLLSEKKRYIEVTSFGYERLFSLGADDLYERVDIWCEDCILDLRQGPLFNMVLMQMRSQVFDQVGLKVHFRLRKRGSTGPEAVSLRLEFGVFEQVKIGELIEKARKKLEDWYPETYGTK